MGRISDWFFGSPKSFPANLPTAPVTYETPNLGPYAVITSNGTELRIDLSWLQNCSPVQLYATQPYLRSVISFLGRNVAQLGVGTFLRVDDDNRARDTGSVAAKLLAAPNPYMTRYELFDALVCDVALWDEGFWWVRKDSSRSDIGWRIDPLPAAWVTQYYDGNATMPEYWQVTQPNSPTVRIPSAQVVHFHGWNPNSLIAGTSPVGTLKAILEEQIAGVVYRQQRWTRGARVGTVITRPADAPSWSPEAEDRFRREFNEKFAGPSGTDSGGTPILQDGMTVSRIGFSAVEDEFIEANKLALTTVAAVYHVNPTMVGLLDNANYSNVREFRRMLYGDTLGPWLAMLEGRINGFLLPMIGAPAEQYIEFNINEKLQGSFEEQAAVAATAIGGPYMTRNEYRARQNLPPIDGADELIVPLNVSTAGAPPPSEGLSQVVQATFMPLDDGLRRSVRAPAGAAGATTYLHGGVVRTAQLATPMAKLGATQRQVNGTAEVLRRFYAHQGSVVLTELGTKSADDWWDEDRWDEELADDLYAVSMRVNKDLGGKQIDQLGVPDPFDPEGNAEYLRAVMTTRAVSINATTKAQIDDALERAGEEDAPTPKDVFTSAQGDRATTGAQSLMTTVAGIAIEEAGKQAERQAGGEATKTWVVTSSNSRHPEMDGETVKLSDNFSNGAAWPGDASLGPDETSGCTCELVINLN